MYSTPADKIEYGKFTTPICNSTDTTLSAFKLINALCMGCVENIKTLQGLLNDLFYSGTHYSGFIVFSLEGGEKVELFQYNRLKMPDNFHFVDEGKNCTQLCVHSYGSSAYYT